MSPAPALLPGPSPPPPVPDELRVNVGVLGVEAVHEWDRRIRLNTPRTEGFPRYLVREINGLHDRADSDDNRQPAMGQVGELPLPSLLRGKTVTYEGEVQALSLADLRLARREFLAAFASNAEREMRSIPDPAYPGGTEHTFRASCTAFSCPDRQEAGPTRVPSPYVRSFTLALRQNDPRYYDKRTRQASAAWAAGVGRVWPENAGTAPTDPVIVIQGPASAAGWYIARLSGEIAGHLELLGVALAPGDRLSFDFARRTAVRASDGLDMATFLSPSSGWWDEGMEGLHSGINALELRGNGLTDASSITVRWRDASW